MLINKVSFIIALISITAALQFQTSEMSADERNGPKTNKTDVSDESGHEVETDPEEIQEKKFLDDAMRTVLDPTTMIIKSDDVVENFKFQLEELDKVNTTLDAFMVEMDKLSLEVCKTSQEALWSYLTDINNDSKKNKMVRIAAEEDEIKKQYWNIFKKKYLNNTLSLNDPNLKRKIRIIKERGTNVQMPQSKQREEIDTMQKIWYRVTVCAYNTSCNTEESVKTMSDIIAIFKTSNDTDELAYYWKAYRDNTGKKIRPIFKDYVIRMNKVAESENFTDAGDMWRYAFEDDHFTETVGRIWHEIKPFYDLLYDYVRAKLKVHYKDVIRNNDNLIPAHILGNLWAQEWQALYPKVAAYPDKLRPKLNDAESIRSKDLFDAVDQFHQSLGFESAKDSYQDNKETMATANCIPSSHDMCDGVNYKIKWCGEKITDLVVDLSRAARLLGHVQYFKHYRNLPPLYRNGPNPAFYDAISDIVAVQLTLPEHLKTLNLAKVVTGPKVTMNHLLLLALEKFPLMAYAYVLDRWRWDVFRNSSMQNWNEHWWNLRLTILVHRSVPFIYPLPHHEPEGSKKIKTYHENGPNTFESRIRETGVSPPVPRNESDLDPASKYHVVSHAQYITYFVSQVLEFQILLSLCKNANHTGPLHQCSIYGVKEAGKKLSDGMALGASEDWRTVLQKITGETELSTIGILEYFSTLQDFLKKENARLALITDDDMDKTAPIVVGSIIIILILLIIIIYYARKHNCGRKICAVCGLSKNGSLDIATNEMPQSKSNEAEGIREDKV